MKSGLVSVQWLLKELRSPGLCILDATWCLSGSQFSYEEGTTGRERYEEGPRIPGARFWDLDEWSESEAADLSPHNLPSVQQFAKAASVCGLRPNSRVVCYDQFGIFSSPRLWFTLKYFGITDVSILDGGLPAWEAGGGSVEQGHIEALSAGSESIDDWSCASVEEREFSQWRLQQVKAWLDEDKKVPLLDARSKARFDGSVPDPRGLRSGHIPGSSSLPFTDILIPRPELASPNPKYNGGALRGAGLASDDALMHIFLSVLSEDALHDGVALSCGSGLTAATLALGLHRIGAKRISLYDGSWAEYGAQTDTPVDTTPPPSSSTSTASPAASSSSS